MAVSQPLIHGIVATQLQSLVWSLPGIPLGVATSMFAAITLGLGVKLVLGLVNCFVASLLLLPVLLHWWPLKDSGKVKTGAPTD